jgi:hypothetical protein
MILHPVGLDQSRTLNVGDASMNFIIASLQQLWAAF